VLITVVVILYVDSVVGNATGLALPKQYIDAAWLLLFALGPAFTALWVGKTMLQENRRKIGAIFTAVGVAFLAKPVEGFYFWSQTYIGIAFPYAVVAFGMFAPLLLMVSALTIAVVAASKVQRMRDWVWALRNPYFYAAGIMALVPTTLVGVKEGLPNTIIKALMYWGLGYTWFDWYAVSLYLFSFVLYIYLIRLLTSNLERSLPSTMIKLGFASFPLNGLIIMLFGYSSIPGNLLSLDAVVVGLLLLKNRQEAGKLK